MPQCDWCGETEGHGVMCPAQGKTTMQETSRKNRDSDTGERMTTDPRTFTLEQCCDFLAECKGWNVTSDGIWYRLEWPCWETDIQSIRAGLLPRHDHPVPSNLDSISKALPESWVWCIINFADDDVYVSCHPKGKCSEESAVVMWKPADELLTRAIVCCLAWQIARGEMPCGS